MENIRINANIEVKRSSQNENFQGRVVKKEDELFKEIIDEFENMEKLVVKNVGFFQEK